VRPHAPTLRRRALSTAQPRPWSPARAPQAPVQRRLVAQHERDRRRGAERTVAVAGLHDPLRRFARDRVERLLVRRGRRGGRGRRRERGLDAPRAPATRSAGRRPSAGAAPRRRRGRRAPRPRGAHALRGLCRSAPATIPWRITGGTPPQPATAWARPPGDMPCGPIKTAAPRPAAARTAEPTSETSCGEVAGAAAICTPNPAKPRRD
jgi:hypothetical protein